MLNFRGARPKPERSFACQVFFQVRCIIASSFFCPLNFWTYHVVCHRKKWVELVGSPTPINESFIEGEGWRPEAANFQVAEISSGHSLPLDDISP